MRKAKSHQPLDEKRSLLTAFIAAHTGYTIWRAVSLRKNSSFSLMTCQVFKDRNGSFVKLSFWEAILTSQLESSIRLYYSPLYENEQKWERKTPVETTTASTTDYECVESLPCQCSWLLWNLLAWSHRLPFSSVRYSQWRVVWSTDAFEDKRKSWKRSDRSHSFSRRTVRPPRHGWTLDAKKERTVWLETLKKC